MRRAEANGYVRIATLETVYQVDGEVTAPAGAFDRLFIVEQYTGSPAAGRVRDALKAYQRLVAAHPDSPLAGTAQLAIGQLYLGPASDPAAALRAFDAYLVHPGPLAEEAAHGRISALLRLGRDDDATAAIDRFLARYPASSYADALRRQSAP